MNFIKIDPLNSLTYCTDKVCNFCLEYSVPKSQKSNLPDYCSRNGVINNIIKGLLSLFTNWIKRKKKQPDLSVH